MAEDIKYDVNKALRHVKVVLRVKGVKRMELRVRFALWLIKIAVLISGMGFEYLGIVPTEEGKK